MMTETCPSPIVSARQALQGIADLHPYLRDAISSSLGRTTSSEPSPPSPKIQEDSHGKSDFLNLDLSHHAKIPILADVATWFAKLLRGDERKPASLAISGPPGTGKTHVARRIKKFAESYGQDIVIRKRLSHWSCLWVDWCRIAETEDQWLYEDFIYQIKECTFVVLDDVGSETDRFKSGVPCSRLRRVLSEIEKKWVVITCNPNMNQIVELYDVRVADRLRSFKWMDLGDTPSYRPKLKP